MHENAPDVVDTIVHGGRREWRSYRIAFDWREIRSSAASRLGFHDQWQLVYGAPRVGG